ncbi:hypothetical protein NLI96_g12359 [Meripilus lineatus]|uniref:F-box domain-containing protein n=1 Tax=Meripilus lineatus TaxID=2056292 RepID=A0AAD5UQ83_9APHY|nr:hypothetical protein NLI96_g12359 [Physisporinus lineatus]
MTSKSGLQICLHRPPSPPSTSPLVVPTFGPLSTIEPKLPLEICEFIVGFVGFEDSRSFLPQAWKTLHSCLLVCRDWVPASRIHLYNFVHLDNPRKAINFMETVTANTHLGQYVRGLGIDSKRTSSNWIYKIHQVLPPLLPNLTRLQYIRLPVVHRLFFPLSARFNHVTHLEIHLVESWSLREVTHFLSRFTRLEKIHFSWCNWDSRVSGPLYCRRANGRNNGMLSSLTLSLSSTHPLEGLPGWFAGSRYYSLNHLSLSLDDLEAPSRVDIDKFLVQCSGTLESVRLSICTWDKDLTTWREMVHKGWKDPREDQTQTLRSPPLAGCRELRRLEVYIPSQVHTNGDRTIPRCTLEFIGALLPHLPSSICSVRLGFSAEASVVFATENVRFWEVFDSTLASSRLPKLASVELGWSGEKRPYDFKQLIPKIYARNILWCTAKPSSETTAPDLDPIATMGEPVSVVLYPEPEFEFRTFHHHPSRIPNDS